MKCQVKEEIVGENRGSTKKKDTEWWRHKPIQRVVYSPNRSACIARQIRGTRYLPVAVSRRGVLARLGLSGGSVPSRDGEDVTASVVSRTGTVGTASMEGRGETSEGEVV